MIWKDSDTQISNFNSSAFYASREYLAESYTIEMRENNLP